MTSRYSPSVSCPFPQRVHREIKVILIKSEVCAGKSFSHDQMNSTPSRGITTVEIVTLSPTDVKVIVSMAITSTTRSPC